MSTPQAKSDLVGIGRALAAAAIVFAAPAAAAEDNQAAIEARLEALKQALSENAALLREIDARMQRQQAELDAAEQALAALEREQPLAATAEPSAPDSPAEHAMAHLPPAPPEAPLQPVGAAPPPSDIPSAALPERVNVLTTPGRFVWESTFSLSQSSSDRVLFRGFEIVPGVQVGLLDANDVERTQISITQGLRYGLTPRIEVEVTAPYLLSQDRETSTVQREGVATVATRLEGEGLGDLELTGRYQLTDGAQGRPVLVANLRVKPPTGEDPFELAYDSDGVLQSLPTGSGFWGVEPSLTALHRSDPAVIFGSLGYLYNVERTIDRTLGAAQVGKVIPGGAINASLGFALAVNDRASLSLGFRDSFVFSTAQDIDGVRQESQSLHIGSLLVGGSYRLSDRLSIGQNLEIGATANAPGFVWTTRVPWSF